MVNTGPRQRDRPRRFQWTASEDRTLLLCLREGYTLPVIAARFSCGIPAIQRRIRELCIDFRTAPGRVGKLIDGTEHNHD